MRCSPLVSRKADLVLAVRSDMNVLFVAYNWRMNYNFMWCEQLPKHAFGIAMCYLSWEVILWLKLSAHHTWEDNLAYWLFIISCKYEQTDVSDHVRSICSLFHFLQAVQLKGCRSISFRIIDSLKKKGVLVDVLSLKSHLDRTEPPVQV